MAQLRAWPWAAGCRIVWRIYTIRAIANSGWRKSKRIRITKWILIGIPIDIEAPCESDRIRLDVPTGGRIVIPEVVVFKCVNARPDTALLSSFGTIGAKCCNSHCDRKEDHETN